MAKDRICSVDGCDKPKHAHGYCSRHAYHFKAHGDPLKGRFGASPGEPLRWIKENAKHEGDECLKWPFETTHHGYGTIKHNGKKRVASRVMCEVAHGEPPTASHEAAHSCGNGHLGCVNPKHLRWATRAENIEDAKAHGTWQKGMVKKSKNLDEDKIRRMRKLFGKNRVKDIAEEFGVCPTTVSQIKSGVLWAWVDG